jgi:hypothetical protein
MRIDIWFTSSSYLHMTSNLFAKKKNELLFKDAIRGMAKKKKKNLDQMSTYQLVVRSISGTFRLAIGFLCRALYSYSK